MRTTMRDNEIKKIYEELRGSFCVIGLTGAIGSGCTTAARFLSKKENINSEIDSILNQNQNKENDNLEEYRVKRIKQFLKNNQYESFYHIKVSNLLFCLFFSSNIFDDEKKLKEYYLEDWFSDKNHIEKIRNLSANIVGIVLGDIKSNDFSSSYESLHQKLSEIDTLIGNNVTKSGGGYTKAFQKIGDDLRKDGLKEYFKGSQLNRFNIKSNIFTISEFIRLTIHHLRDEGYKFFVIDALRNLFEINFFKARYANFFLFSINASQEVREKRLLGNFEYKNQELIDIQKREKSKEERNSQNINICISNGDVFIENNDILNLFHYQILKYVCLIRKPGLFTPTASERYMQIALTARYNSGCISRQVGACVVSENGKILGVGWNDVPTHSIPCLYRTAKSLLLENNSDPEFSKYETSHQFKSYLRDHIGPKDQPFCFKDFENKRHTYSEIKKLKQLVDLNLNDEQEDALLNKIKNPTRERALHAEEKAFLQSSSLGNEVLEGATLYTTDSPCQLCAKKSIQLGIKKIIYIDAYPDISNDQTLKSGPENKRPVLKSFTGVAESAFMRLFKPLIGIKDEIYQN